jgi:hypothetical protein
MILTLALDLTSFYATVADLRRSGIDEADEPTGQSHVD